VLKESFQSHQGHALCAPEIRGDYSIVIVAVEEVCVEHIGDEEIKFRANCPSPLNLGMLKSNRQGNLCREGTALALRSQLVAHTDSKH